MSIATATGAVTLQDINDTSTHSEHVSATHVLIVYEDVSPEGSKVRVAKIFGDVR